MVSAQTPSPRLAFPYLLSRWWRTVCSGGLLFSTVFCFLKDHASRGHPGGVQRLCNVFVQRF